MAPNEPSFLNVCMNVTNTVTQLALGAVAFSAIIFGITFPGTNHLKQHIYLCVFGYVLMMAQAILVFNPHTGWSISLRYQDKKNAHWIIQIAGSILAITGSVIRMSNLNNNFQSAHGVFGLIAMILTVMSLIGGLINLFKTTKFTKIVHSCAGSLTLAAAFITLCLGFDRNIYRATMGDTSATVLIFLTVATFAGIILSASISNIKRVFNN